MRVWSVANLKLGKAVSDWGSVPLGEGSAWRCCAPETRPRFLKSNINGLNSIKSFPSYKVLTSTTNAARTPHDARAHATEIPLHGCTRSWPWVITMMTRTLFFAEYSRGRQTLFLFPKIRCTYCRVVWVGEYFLAATQTPNASQSMQFGVWVQVFSRPLAAVEGRELDFCILRSNVYMSEERADFISVVFCLFFQKWAFFYIMRHLHNLVLLNTVQFVRNIVLVKS